MSIEKIKDMKFNDDELKGNFSKLCDFDREYYLNQEYFEKKFVDAECEFLEFNGDGESLARELAYTRYLLTKAELLIKEMLTKQAEKGEKGETIWQ